MHHASLETNGPVSVPDAGDTRRMPLLSDSTRQRWQDPHRSDRPDERNDANLSILQLTNSMIGSGILSFPYVFAATGWVLGCVLLATFAVLNIVTNLMLLETGAAVGQETGDTSEIIEAALKSTRWRRLIDACIALQAFGSLLSYNNVMGDLGAAILLRHKSGAYPAIIAAGNLVLSPVCFSRAYGDIAWVSILSIACMVLTTSIIAIKGAVAESSLPASPSSAGTAVATIGNFAFAMANQFAVHETYASMKPQNRPAIKRVVSLAAALGSTLLLLMAIAGLAAIGSSSRRLASNIIESLNPDLPITKFIAGNTIFHIMAYIPNDFIIMRLYGCRFFDVNPLTIPLYRYVALTSILLIIPLVTMAVIPRSDVLGVFELIVTLTGATPVTLGVFIIPIYAFKVSCIDEKRSPEKSLFPFLRRHTWLTYSALLLTLFILVVVPIVSVYIFASECVDTSCSNYGHRR